MLIQHAGEMLCHVQRVDPTAARANGQAEREDEPTNAAMGMRGDISARPAVKRPLDTAEPTAASDRAVR